MGNFYDHITDEQADLIGNSRMFFIASADPEFVDGAEGAGPLNLSPKGGSPLHVLSPHKVAYLDYPGSGNETAAHIGQGSPVTLMVMAGDEADAAIVRLYGKGVVHSVEGYEHAEQLLASPAEHLSQPRQIIEIEVAKTQTSCGYGVPIFKFVKHRPAGNRGRRYK